MGLFSDRLKADYEGVPILIHTDITHILPLQARTRLLIAGKAAGEVSFVLGQHTLPGAFRVGDIEHRVVVSIHQRPFSTRYKLEIDGQEQPLRKLK